MARLQLSSDELVKYYFATHSIYLENVMQMQNGVNRAFETTATSVRDN